MPTGDRVIFGLPNQRVDKVDLEAMSVLMQEALSRTVGALLGETSGVLTNVPFEYDEVLGLLTIGPCMLAWGDPREESLALRSDNFLRGGVLIHDPTRPGQVGNSTLDLNEFGPKAWLWFRRRTTQADNDNRAYWPATGSGELVAPVNTREREWVEFAATESLTTSEISRETGWYRFATFFKSSLGAPNLVPFSAFGDDHEVEDPELLTSLWGSFMGFGTSSLSEPTRPSGKPWGLGRVVQELIRGMLLVRDTDVTVDSTSLAITSNANQTSWRSLPTRGLKQLNDFIVQTRSETSQDVQSMFDSYTQGRVGVLATIVHTKPVNTEGGNMQSSLQVVSPFMTVSTTPYKYWGIDGEAVELVNPDEASWFLITCQANPTKQYPATGAPTSFIELPPEYNGVVITSVHVQPYHPETWVQDDKFNNGSKGSVAEVQQWLTFPTLVRPAIQGSGIPATTQKFKVRFRDVDDADKQISARGWTMVIYGYPTRFNAESE